MITERLVDCANARNRRVTLGRPSWVCSMAEIDATSPSL